MINIVLFILFIYLCIKIIQNMDAISKYFESIIFLIIGLIPPCIGLLIFDHSALSKSDILLSTGMWFWATICLFYSATFIFLYSMSFLLIHPTVWAYLKIDNTPQPDDWKGAILQMVFSSFIAGIITWLTNGNFIHYVGDSFIVLGISSLLSLTSYFFLERERRKSA
jgi:hypothetical protein